MTRRAAIDAANPVAAARAAGLRYVRDDDPGISRRRAGSGFTYVDAEGRRVGDRHTLARIRSLVIPPAWRDVWICARADGHIQAVGRDARGRKQYRYHPDWRQQRDATKYERLVAFARRLPAIRRRVAADLRRTGMPREKVVALVVRLLETTSIRIGNPEYARANGSFGLTTLRNRHVDVSGARARFRFRGKAGKLHEIDVDDRALARLIRKCQELPGQELFTYVDDDGSARAIDSGDVNQYLRDAVGEDFSAKDFRTWAGTVAAALSLGEKPGPESEPAAKRAIADSIKEVAAHLGNTATVCRKCYVHPLVLEAFARGVTIHSLPGARPLTRGLAPDERAVLALLASAGDGGERRAAS
jgi:DNA topoisomerase-1